MIPIVYLCHPYAGDGDPVENARRVRSICKKLCGEPAVPLGPHIYLPQFLDERTQRAEALALCLRLVDVCDQVRVFGGLVTAGMELEIDRARSRGIPVHFVQERV